MKTADFNFHLPAELIAQYPLAKRSDSRLLSYERNSQQYSHHQFHQLDALLEPGDLLVMNDSRVIPARLYGNKASGGKVELLIERMLTENTFLAHIKASKAPRAGTIIYCANDWQIEVLVKQDDLYHCQVVQNSPAPMTLAAMLQQIGHMPLPPYITRQDETLDLDRYQTVYARHQGSVAAPTAGLHFDAMLLAQLQARGIQIAYTTLHVGAGTFRPVRCAEIHEHKMHTERYHISAQLCAAVQETQAAGHRVIAVGTTALRSLESAAKTGQLIPGDGETDIFIVPGYQFKLCDGLITNFHLPESTLLMLVAAFIGYEQTMRLYQLAIEQRYRFFSYGDATLLL